MPVEFIGQSRRTALLEVRGLTVVVKNRGHEAALLREADFSAEANECLVLIGESGSGKSTLARALTSLFRPNSGLRISGSVVFDGKNLLTDRSAKDQVRYVLQEPGLALNPALKIGAQLKILNGSSDLDGICSRLRAADIGDPARVLDLYPHEISVGMAQRVLLAAALNAHPRLLICDEPTSAVDLESRELILNMLLAYAAEANNTLVVVTHDLIVARRIATRIAVLYNGLIVEMAPVEEFYRRPLHPYSQALLSMLPSAHTVLEAMPVLQAARRDQPSGGCVYAANCYKAQPDCRETEPAFEMVEAERSVRCLYWK